MPVQAYVDPDSIHNPASGGIAPATWFTTIEADFRSITGRVSARIYNDTTEDFAIPGPTTISLPDTDFNNGMTVGSNAITVPASYAGKYLIVAGLRVTSIPSAANFVAIGVGVNGTEVIQEIPARSGATGSLNTFSRAFTYALAVADVLTLRVTTSGVSDADTEVTVTMPSLAAFWLSP